MPKVAIYTFTRDRLDYTKRTLDSMRDTRPGHAYDHWIFDQGSEDGTQEYIKAKIAHGRLFDLTEFGHNLGLHVGKNTAHDQLLTAGYDFIMKVDNDIEFKTQHWLRKLLAAYRALGNDAVISPRIKGLNNPPQSWADKRVGKFNFAFVSILGGATRFTTRKTIESFRYNERMPMAMGAASTFANHCMAFNIPLAYCEDIIVRHMDTTKGQEEANPDYFDRSAMERIIPYGL